MKNYLTRTNLVPRVRVTLVHQKVDFGNEIGLGLVCVADAKRGGKRGEKRKGKGYIGYQLAKIRQHGWKDSLKINKVA